jgi:hypothetical protein
VGCADDGVTQVSGLLETGPPTWMQQRSPALQQWAPQQNWPPEQLGPVLLQGGTTQLPPLHVGLSAGHRLLHAPQLKGSFSGSTH